MEDLLKDFFKNELGVWLFGSFANNTFNENSDIDVAVLFRDEKSRLDVFKIKEELEFLLKRDVDLIDIKKADTVFQYQIVTTAKKLLTSKEADDFENRIWWLYLTLQDDRKVILEDRVWTKW